ncbi:MAG: ABC-F family ATP-binding cassette domain-containing protein [Desulfobacterales bacterium]|nr:ABC-F family ATP-binding cassette domain-containing protein [Desulfobacterales bacterium]
MIIIDNIIKSFGSNVIFDGISFRVNLKERIGVVGRNGHGKTTLFRLITGDIPYDSGSIAIPKNYRIGYVKQELEFTSETVIQECIQELPELQKNQAWKAEKILSGLGFSKDDMDKSPHIFSGGFQVRINLAKTLVSEPNLLLLDEPTNYLDITAIRWLESFLITWPSELMLITHNRGFMDKTITHVLGIHRKKSKKIQGTTEKYYEQVASEEEVYEKTRINEEKKRKEIDVFISRFRAKARLGNLVQSRIKTLSKMQKKEKLYEIKNLEFSFNYLPFQAKQLISIENLSFSYEKNTPLIRDFSLTVGPKDRICVVGRNGKGKTTLLKLLAGAVKHQGHTNYHKDISIGFFEQTNIESLDDNKTVEDEILSVDPQMGKQQARNICGAILFSGETALKKVEVLSGGEKSRVMLGKILVQPVNCLILDEPTNHLDMDSCDSLLAALDSFEGAIIMVTHNEMFLYAIADRLIVFKDEYPFVFEGSYQYFLEKIGWEQNKDNIFLEKDNNKNVKSKKEVRRQRSAIMIERSKILKPIEDKISNAEKEIESLETSLNEYNDLMISFSQQRNGEGISRISKSMHEANTKLKTLYDVLDGLYNELEEVKKNFDD